jgi:hypothetical protein
VRSTSDSSRTDSSPAGPCTSTRGRCSPRLVKLCRPPARPVRARDRAACSPLPLAIWRHGTAGILTSGVGHEARRRRTHGPRSGHFVQA